MEVNKRHSLIECVIHAAVFCVSAHKVVSEGKMLVLLTGICAPRTQMKHHRKQQRRLHFRLCVEISEIALRCTAEITWTFWFNSKGGNKATPLLQFLLAEINFATVNKGYFSKGPCRAGFLETNDSRSKRSGSGDGHKINSCSKRSRSS